MPDANALATQTIRCPAKLNLTLAVGPPRDDGLHPIASVMIALNFGDTLQLQRLDGGPSRFDRRFASDAPRPQRIDWPVESDLAFRAHGLLEKAAGRPLPIACTIDKRMPAGAGLGGGSSNAAGTLVGLRSLFELPLKDDDLIQLAQRLGADVAFLVHALLGQPAALVTGIGDIVEPIASPPACHCVLVFPDGTCPTPAVYRAFDEQRNAQPIDSDLIAAWRNTCDIPAPHNDLTQAATQVCPAIAADMRTISATRHEPRLTGSGSALFVLVESKAAGDALVELFAGRGLTAASAAFLRPSL